MISNLETCPVCFAKKLLPKQGTFRIKFDGENVAVSDVAYFECEQCGEQITDYENEKKIDLFLRERRSA